MSQRNLSATIHAYERCLRGYTLDMGEQYESKSWDGARLVFDGSEGVLPNIPARNLNVKYAIEEFLWYCRGDRFDVSILEHATMWKKLMQDDGGFNSNYGQYLFRPYSTPSGMVPSQFDFCVQELKGRTTSRRACMTLLKTDHIYAGNTDMVCTYAIQFFIRNNRLDMHVYMRSNDVVFGLTNDAFCFNMIQRMLCAALQEHYPNLLVGQYTHNAGTLHVYRRHYEMADQAVWEADRYVEVNPPMIDQFDLEALLSDQSKLGGAFMEWARNELQSR